MLLNLGVVLSISFLLSVDAQAVECGRRPTQIINVESRCQEDIKDGLLDRIQQGARGFFERAKQELGIKSDAKVEPKKCEYYRCVFERLGTLNQLDLPDLSLLQTWINNNVDDANKEALNEQAASCFRLLATSALNINNSCDTTLHLMMCLSSVDKCQVFKFP